MNYLELRKCINLQQATSLPSKIDIFEHHFPGTPLLPGALSALLLSEHCGGQDWFLKKINGLRFRKPLTPDLSFTISYETLRESPTEKICAAKIIGDAGTIADGEFTFLKNELLSAESSSPEPNPCIWNGAQIREYLPHGEKIVLIDNLIEANYPLEIQEYLAGNKKSELNQAHLVGTKIHARSTLRDDNFWLDQKVLPSPILNEMVAQAGALTLAPFFTGAKPQVALLGCDTEFFCSAVVGTTIDTFIELSRVKTLGKTNNMIIFKGDCYIGSTKIAQTSINAMASF